jgi:hypothetical protein
MRDGTPRNSDPVLGGNSIRRLLLRATEVVEAQGSCNQPRRIFHAFQSCKGNEVASSILAPVNLQLAKAVLAHATLDDLASVADWTAIWSRLNCWSEARRAFHTGTTPLGFWVPP